MSNPSAQSATGTAGSDRFAARGETQRFYLLIGLSLVLLVLVGWPAVEGKVYTARDLGRLTVPLRHFYAQCLADGDDFNWLPHQFCGFYLHAEGQVGMYHPAHWLLYRALPFPLALNFNLLACYALMLPGGFLWLRRWRLPRDAAMFGAFVFAFSSFNLLHFLHLNALEVIAHIPWLLLAIDVSLRDESHRRAAWANAGLSVLTASQLLMGHPHYLFLTGVVEVLYVLLVGRSGRGGSRLLMLAAAKALGIAAGAVQLLPTWQALVNSSRFKPTLEYLGRNSLHPASTLNLVSPYLANDLYMGGRRQAHNLYNGALTTVLVVWILLRTKRRHDRRVLVRAAFVLAGVGLFLAYGRYNPLFESYASLPLLDKIRAPHRSMVVIHLAFGALAAVGFAELSSRARRGAALPWRRLWPLLSVPLASAGVVLGVQALMRLEPGHPALQFVAPTPLLLLGIALMTGATALVLASSRGARLAPVAMVLFMAFDLGVFGISYVWKLPPSTVADWVDARLQPPEPTEHRVHYGRLEKSHVAVAIAGIHMTGGYMQLRYPKLLDYAEPEAQRLAGVDWAWSADGWVRRPDPLPRARLVTAARVSVSPSADLGSIDLETTALVAEPVDLEGGPPGRAGILEERPGRIRVAASAPRRQLLVVAESFHEGWRAAVDGRSRPVVRVYGDFIGCVVPPGESVVELRFRPADLRLGAVISLSALALVSLWLAVALRRGKRG